MVGAKRALGQRAWWEAQSGSLLRAGRNSKQTLNFNSTVVRKKETTHCAVHTEQFAPGPKWLKPSGSAAAVIVQRQPT